MTARAFAGIIGLVVVLLLVGWAVLIGAGVVRSRREAFRALPLAIFIGWATTGLVDTIELMLGLRVNGWETIAGDALVTAVALAVATRVPAARRPEPQRRRRTPLVLVLQAVVGVYLLGMLADSLVARGLANSESWSQWLVKAKVIYFFGLDTGVGGYTSQQNGTYPPLDSALESTVWHFAGKPDFLLLPFLHWIVFASMIGAAAYLLLPRIRAEFVWGPLAMLVLAPKLTAFVGSSLGEELVAEFLGLGAVLALLWLREDDDRWLALAGICLAAAAMTKNEGLVMGVILAVLVAVTRRRPLGLALVASPLVLQIPWKLWQKANHVPPTFAYDWNRYFHPDRLFARFDYVTYGARGLAENTFSPAQWLLIVPAALVLALLLAWRRRPLAVVGLGFPILTFIAFEITYWAGKDICQWEPGTRCDGTWHDIVWLVGLSIDRLPLYFVVVAAMMLPLLLAEAEAASRPADAKGS